jgi:hypothetical protein
MRAMLQEGAIEVYALGSVCGVLKARRTPERHLQQQLPICFFRPASLGFASEFRDS